MTPSDERTTWDILVAGFLFAAGAHAFRSLVSAFGSTSGDDDDDDDDERDR